MESITAIIGLVTAIISLIAAMTPLILLIKKKKDQEIPTTDSCEKNDNVTKDNRMHTSDTTHVEFKQIIYVSSGNAPTTNDDGMIMGIGIGILLLFLYANRVILLQVMYIPLIMSALLSVLICIFYMKGLPLTPIHPYKTVNIIFALIPAFISTLFVIQNKLFLFDIDSVEFAQRLQIGTTILFDYAGVFFLLFAQFCVLIVSYVRFPKIRTFMINFSRLWPTAAVLPLVPIILWCIQR